MTPGVVKFEPRGDVDVPLPAVIAPQLDVLVFKGGAGTALGEHDPEKKPFLDEAQNEN